MPWTSRKTDWSERKSHWLPVCAGDGATAKKAMSRKLPNRIRRFIDASKPSGKDLRYSQGYSMSRAYALPGRWTNCYRMVVRHLVVLILLATISLQAAAGDSDL